MHAFLRRSYWASGRSREAMEKSIRNSLCFGAYEGAEQIAFARVVTDGCTFAYLCDVFVDEAHRSRGVGKELMKAVMAHPELRTFRRFALTTSDAHGLYERYGFREVLPGKWMEIQREER